MEFKKNDYVFQPPDMCVMYPTNTLRLCKVTKVDGPTISVRKLTAKELKSKRLANILEVMNRENQ